VLKNPEKPGNTWKIGKQKNSSKTFNGKDLMLVTEQ
jgi:hypothetical protein